MGKGGGETRTTTSTTEPPAFLTPFLQGGIQDLTNLYHAGSAPDYYPGQTYAPMSSQTQGAIDMITGRATSGSPVTGAAQGLATDVLSGGYLDPTSNPTFKAALAASHDPQNREFLTKIIPGITSAFTGSGATGSGLHQEMVRNATMDLAQAQANADAQAGNSYYNAERDRMTGMAGMSPQLANADYLDALMLQQAGNASEGYAQQGIDENVARYNYENNKDWDYINRYLGSLGAGYPGGTTTGTSSGGGGDGFSSALGSIMSFAALPMMLFSDERLKEDAEPIGRLNDGQTVWSYRYKGDPTPRIGLMAQEVAQTHPEAVGVDPSGFLKVDYGLATRDARGLF